MLSLSETGVTSCTRECSSHSPQAHTQEGFRSKTPMLDTEGKWANQLWYRVQSAEWVILCIHQMSSPHSYWIRLNATQRYLGLLLLPVLHLQMYLYFFYFRFCWLMCGVWRTGGLGWRFGCVSYMASALYGPTTYRGVFILPPMRPVLGLDLGLAPDPLQS